MLDNCKESLAYSFFDTNYKIFVEVLLIGSCIHLLLLFPRFHIYQTIMFLSVIYYSPDNVIKELFLLLLWAAPSMMERNVSFSQFRISVKMVICSLHDHFLSILISRMNGRGNEMRETVQGLHGHDFLFGGHFRTLGIVQGAYVQFTLILKFHNALIF